MSCNTNICGEWEDEQDDPTGQCSSRRLKRSCDAPLLYTNVAQTATDTCPEGTVGDVISVTIEAGTINNPFSVAAANAEALDLAEARVSALRAISPCLYPNTEQVCTETCPDGTVGDPITVTIAAGEYTAETQEEADALALAAACEQAALLRAETPCYWQNAEQQCTDTCPEGMVGDPITVVVTAGEYTSTVSQEAADAIALAAACAEVEALREGTPCYWENEEQQCTETCPEGFSGDPITVTVAAGEYTSYVSQEDANSQALAAACDEAADLRAATPCVEEGECTYVYLDEDMPPENYNVSLWWAPGTTTFNYTADSLAGTPYGKIAYSDVSGGFLPGGINALWNVYLFRNLDWEYDPVACGNVVSFATKTFSAFLNAFSAYDLKNHLAVFQGTDVFVANFNPNGVNNPLFFTDQGNGAGLNSWNEQNSLIFPTSSCFNRYSATGNFIGNTAPNPAQAMQFGFVFIADAHFPIATWEFGVRHFEITVNV